MFRSICPSAFFRCFMSNHRVYTESRIETFIRTIGIDCFNSVNHDQVQGLSYSKYSLSFLPVVGIEPAENFTQKHFPTKRHILCAMCPCRTMQSEFLGFIKLMSLSTHEVLFSTIISDGFVP